ncbi:glycoside hydrolase [Schizophyllum amplum]|uniref:alpha-1,2-Mannosidase n=1 Tax=Schizophyllum amplum TaxID=97359 RepID=A0A550C3J4_9AGAR|nr:glycoside hydrolase [Auriculariopsis ampla]
MADNGARLRKRTAKLGDKDAPASKGGMDKGTDVKRNPILARLLIIGAAVGLLLTATKTYTYFEGRSSGQRFDGLSGQAADFTADVDKRDAVVRAFQHAWHAYEKDAMGYDEYHPISHTGSNLGGGQGIGYTVVDSIDTMLLMHLDDEYQRARGWIANNLSFDQEGEFSTFETTIRAVDLADRMLPAFDTKTGLPLPRVNLKLRQGSDDPDNKGLLEFKYLAHLTDNDEYWRKAEQVMRVIKDNMIPQAVLPIFMSAEGGQFLATPIRLGSRGDSYYEYLIKQYLQTDGSEDVYRQMYADAMAGIHKTLVSRSMGTNLLYTSELVPERNQQGGVQWRLVPKQDHLVCFLGGSLMLGAVTTEAAADNVSVPPHPDELTEVGQRDWTTGVELVKTCMATHDTQTGLSPEIVHFRIPSDGIREQGVPEDWYIKGAAPETVESLFIAWRLTGDTRYRAWGWDIFQAIEKYCKLEGGGYAGIMNVDDVRSEKDDKMETFLMSETLKYLFLLFEDASVLPLDKYVFNTEAHPLPVFHPTLRTGFS